MKNDDGVWLWKMFPKEMREEAKAYNKWLEEQHKESQKEKKKENENEHF